MDKAVGMRCSSSAEGNNEWGCTSAPLVRLRIVDTDSLTFLGVHHVIREIEFSETSNFHSLSMPTVS